MTTLEEILERARDVLKQTNHQYFAIGELRRGFIVRAKTLDNHMLMLFDESGELLELRSDSGPVGNTNRSTNQK